MKQSISTIMKQPHNTNSELADAIFAIVRYIPVLALLVAAGFLAIFIFAETQIFGNPAWQLLALAGVGLLASTSYYIVLKISERKRDTAAYVLYAVTTIVVSALLVILWDGALAVAALLVWIQLLAIKLPEIRRRTFTFSLLANISVIIIATFLLVWLDRSATLGRLTLSNGAGLAALIFLVSAIVLFVVSAIVSGSVRYRTLQNRLITSFVLIIAFAILFTTLVAGANAFTNSQNQFRDTLQSVSSLKRDQIDAHIQQTFDALNRIQQGAEGGVNIRYVLQHFGENDDLYRINASRAANSLDDFLVNQHGEFQKFMFTDVQGNVILSTYTVDRGRSLGDENYIKQGLVGNYAGLIKPLDNQSSDTPFELVVAVPIYGADGQTLLGVLALIGDTTYIDQVMGTTPGLPNAETYLVNGDLLPVTQTKPAAVTITTKTIANISQNQAGEGSTYYSNYANLPVFGYYQWYDTLHAVMVAEIPLGEIVSRALGALLVSGLVGVFVILIAIVAVLATARTISEPVVALAKTAEQFASGNLNVRAQSEQPDEIGNLARSFNSMAAQLQETISNLEQRVAERTQGLEQQTLRLRTAAEVARDAASAPGIDELLDRAARLIWERFKLYHTGIFLLDEKKEYAVFYASPTEAGRQMLANHHRLRVGAEGIVGRVAETGEPRIALDTGVDPVYFSNPYLPNTRSEMSLPFKSNEGVIGVLDIQSDQPEAFTQDDIAIMQVMADLLSTAIEKTRLIQQVQSSLLELERTYSSVTEQSWKIFERTAHQAPGYRYDNIHLEPLREISHEALKVLEQNVPVSDGFDSEAKESMAIPVRLRGQTIGVIQVRFQNKGEAKATTLMIEQIADRLATALENARLLEDSLNRANKERVIGEITSKISASINMRNVLQTAVEELGRAIPGSDVVIQLVGDDRSNSEEK